MSNEVVSAIDMRVPSAHDERIEFCGLPTPLGTLRLAATATGLREIAFADPTGALRAAPSDWKEAAIDPPEGPAAEWLARSALQLEEYFSGQRESFELRLAPQGTTFQRAVWRLLCGIPFGATTSYGEIASQLGRPTASRAVGAANGRNPIPIVVPCHRVIGRNGNLTGYAGGLATKEFLLELEGTEIVGLSNTTQQTLFA